MNSILRYLVNLEEVAKVKTLKYFTILEDWLVMLIKLYNHSSNSIYHYLIREVLITIMTIRDDLMLLISQLLIFQQVRILTNKIIMIITLLMSRHHKVLFPNL